MIQLEPYVKRLISNLEDNYNPNKSFHFAKLEIMDRFWRLEVNGQDEWNLR